MKYFISGIVIIVILIVIVGFVLVGSPKEERARSFDDRRLSDLQVIQSDIISYWQAKQKLPSSLDVLADPLRGITVPTDPERNVPYEYRANGPRSFTLCGIFNYFGDANGAISVPYPVASKMPPAADSWTHGAGEVCFNRTIDTDFWKPYPAAK